MDPRRQWYQNGGQGQMTPTTQWPRHPRGRGRGFWTDPGQNHRQQNPNRQQGWRGSPYHNYGGGSPRFNTHRYRGPNPGGSNNSSDDFVSEEMWGDPWAELIIQFTGSVKEPLSTADEKALLTDLVPTPPSPTAALSSSPTLDLSPPSDKDGTLTTPIALAQVSEVTLIKSTTTDP